MSKEHDKFLEALRGLERKKTPIDEDEVSPTNHPDLDIEKKVFDPNREETEEDGIRQGQLRMLKVRRQAEKWRQTEKNPNRKKK